MVRFDKPCRNARGAVDYFREHMAVGDYLTEEGGSEMAWVGLGAERLGLRGTCRLEDFERLCDGLDPATGRRLGVRDKGSQRRVCYFGQISPPKDVSIVHLVGGDERIGRWWQEAVQDTLQEMEAMVATRIRRAGSQEDRFTGNMVAAVVTHETSRALDPQLHTHVCILNVTWDPVEERWKGVQPSALYQHPGYLREVCYAKLASRLRGAGYQLEPLRGVGFAITGIPQELRARFSQRRRDILAQAAATGARTQAALQAIAAGTRADKQHVDSAQLRRRWIECAGADLGAIHATILAAAQAPPARPRPAAQAEQALRRAAAHVFERNSVIAEPTLLREALSSTLGEVSVEELKQAVAKREKEGALLRVSGRIASREALEAENEFVRWTQAGTAACGRLGRLPPGSALDADQQSAVAELLGSRSRVTVLQGDAGTGKTTCLRAVVAGIEQAGGCVLGCAPSAGATDVLRREFTADAHTLQQLLVNESLQAAARGRLVIVDEAGLISVRQMRDLCRLAARHDFRLLLVGDTKQHGSVEAGDALRCLQLYAEVPTARLTAIRRQRDPALRRAVELLAHGEARRAFDEFQRLGCVHEKASEERLMQAAARDYVATIRSGRSCLAISPVWSEIRAFTEEVRQQLQASGQLEREERTVATVTSFQWTREQHRRIDQYRPGDALTFHRASAGFAKDETVIVERREADQLVVRDSRGEFRSLDPATTAGFDAGQVRDIPVAPGDRLLIRANLKRHGLRNGDLVEVVTFAPDGGIVLQDGRTVPPGFRQFTHGYATTSHASQGKTVDRGLVIMAEAGIAAGNLQQAYVSNSRFRKSHAIYTTDAKAARRAMERPAERQLARELVGPQETRPWRTACLHTLYRLGRLVTAREQLVGWWQALPATLRAAVGRN